MSTKVQIVLEAERLAAFVRFRHLYLWMRDGLKVAGTSVSDMALKLPESEMPYQGDLLEDALTTTAPAAQALRELINMMRASSAEIFDAIEEVAKAADAWQEADAAWRLSSGGA